MINIGPESETVEHKKSTSELKEGVQSIAAMLNKHGYGELYFGVKNNGDVVGQQVADTTLREISQAIGFSIEPRIVPEVLMINDGEGHDYIKVSFEGNAKPYSCKGTYRVRSADEDVLMAGDQVRRMARDAYFKEHPWDEHPSERPLSDINEKELISFVERGRAANRIYYDYEDIVSTLTRHELLVNGKLTNAADVLFCKSKNIMLKLAVFADHSRVNIVDIQQEEGNLFELARKAEFYINSNTRRRVDFDGGLQRVETPELPEKAVREAIINAFAHRSYRSDLPIRVEVFPDAVEIFNPGWFADGDSPEEHLDGRNKNSNGENKLIAKTLFKSRDIETAASGLPRIRTACEEAGIKFAYEKVPCGTNFVFYRNDPFEQMAKGGESWRELARVGEMRPELLEELSERERRIVAFLQNVDTANLTEIQEVIEVSARTTSRDVKRLVEKGVIQAQGSTNNRRYRITAEALFNSSPLG